MTGPIPRMDAGKPQMAGNRTGLFLIRRLHRLRRFISPGISSPVKSANLRNLRIDSVQHRHGTHGRTVGAFHGERQRHEPAPRGADLVEIGQVLDDGDPDGEERLVGRVVGARQLFLRFERHRPDAVIRRVVVPDGLHVASDQPLTGAFRGVGRIPPELLCLDTDPLRPIGAKEDDVSGPHVLPASFQVGRRHLAVLRDVRQVHHGRLADPLLYRHLGDVLRAGQKMKRSVHVGEGMAVDRENRGIKQVAPGMGGFQLLDLHDYLGQGGALVGMLDTFWESKGFVTAEEFRRFCAPVLPLARSK